MNLHGLMSILLLLLVCESALSKLACKHLYRSLLDPVRISNEFVRENNFQVSRTLGSYALNFKFQKESDFHQRLAELPQDAIWFDMGAGEGNALFQGLRSYPHIKKGVAVSYKKPPFSVSNEEMPGRFIYLHGDLVENMWRKGRFDVYEGQVQLITDLYGPMSYSRSLPELLQIYFDLLAPGGELHFNFMEARNHSAPQGVHGEVSRPFLMNPVMTKVGGSARGLIDWFSAIEGVEVIGLAENIAGRELIFESSIAVRLKKTTENVLVPHNLKTHSYNSSNPPRRIFVWTKD